MRHDEILGLLPRLHQFDIGDSPGLELFGLEILFWLAVILLTIALMRHRPAFLEHVESWIRETSQHKRFWLGAFILGVIVVRIALIPWLTVPFPAIHDEFSYLLGGDTFAHGRLTNPPSPMWQHFESFHINVLPTYQSMYPPAQAIALAIGQKLTTSPWAGVVLSTALMCGAIYWMLLGWLPAPWAWLGGMLAWVRFGIFSYWINSYFGGSVAALGGALVLGALPRFRDRPKIQTALIFAAGLLILANSRPLEGFVFCLPLLIALAIMLFKNIRSGMITWGATVRMIAPAMALLVLGGAWMLYYNWRGTGNPLVMPYTVNFETYHVTKPFFFQKPNPIPEYRHAEMKKLYVYHELPFLLRSKYALGEMITLKAADYYVFFIWPFALLLGPCIYAIWRSELRVVLISVGLVAAVLLPQIWPSMPHYAAPAVGAVFLLVLFSVRHFRSSGSASAIWGARALAIVFAVWMICPIAEKFRDPFLIRPRLTGNDALLQQNGMMPSAMKRAAIQAELEARGGKHLVIVHYPTDDTPWTEWVYNGADIDGEPVIWARDMGYFKNKELVDYYPDRQVWYVDHGQQMQPLVPYALEMAGMKLAFDSGPLQAESSRSSGIAPQPEHATAAAQSISSGASGNSQSTLAVKAKL